MLQHLVTHRIAAASRTTTTRTASTLWMVQAFIPRQTNAFAVSRRNPLSKNLVLALSTDANQDDNPMDNLYTQWTLEQDKLLWEHRQESLVTLATLLGRGLRGVSTRLEKLNDVESAAYQRLFVKTKSTTESQKTKLIPAAEILRRIQWDESLPTQEFAILHYDRLDDQLVETPLDSPNNSIEGKDTLFVNALPEHRIYKIKYKERVIWDRQERFNLLQTERMEEIVSGYHQWKEKQEQAEEEQRQRHRYITHRIRHILGLEGYQQLQQLSLSMKDALENPSVSSKQQAETYVRSALQLFTQVRQDPSKSLEPSWIPPTDLLALECLSELVAILPNENKDTMQQVLLVELDGQIQQRLHGKQQQGKNKNNAALPELDEKDLEESFVRGSGAGGQKINKTSNCVVLLHKPTQIRVQCQETRSLQQNRKIARKLLRLKLEDFFEGTKSRTNQKASKASSKKQKAKARSRSRLRRKKEQEGGENTSE